MTDIGETSGMDKLSAAQLGSSANLSSAFGRARLRTWQILHVEGEALLLAKIVNATLVILIFLNLLAITADTMPRLTTRYGHILWRFEVFTIIIFSIEYLLRVWCCTVDPRYRHPVRGRLRFVLTPLAIIDLLSILPFYLPGHAVEYVPLRLLRIIRFVRILKLGHYSESLQLVGMVLRDKKADLASAVLLATVCLVISATLLHAAEAHVQPEQFGTLPDCMWWAVITMTTVGYGDVYPKTAVGKVLGGFVAFIGIGMFALPAGILGAGFLEARHKREQEQKSSKVRCPNCGHQFDR
jgi:voltage-gated potassium channel